MFSQRLTARARHWSLKHADGAPSRQRPATPTGCRSYGSRFPTPTTSSWIETVVSWRRSSQQVVFTSARASESCAGCCAACVIATLGVPVYEQR